MLRHPRKINLYLLMPHLPPCHQAMWQTPIQMRIQRRNPRRTMLIILLMGGDDDDEPSDDDDDDDDTDDEDEGLFEDEDNDEEEEEHLALATLLLYLLLTMFPQLGIPRHLRWLKNRIGYRGSLRFCCGAHCFWSSACSLLLSVQAELVSF
ncbi:hypothetical protein Tco_1464270 [Tanacetum coccineum]